MRLLKGLFLSPLDPAGGARARTAGPAVTVYWTLPPGELADRLGCGTQGLAGGEAEQRLASFGPNALHGQASVSLVALLARQFASPLLWVLIVAALIAGVLGEWVNSAIVLAIIAASGGLGFWQEYSASQAVERLRASVRVTTRVLRGGQPETVASDQVVPGDVLLLAAGNLVPADGLILQAKDFFVTEAALTGEPLPVEKQPGVVDAASPVARRTNCVFMGTSVRSGTATVLVAETGGATEYGAVANRLRRPAPETEFERGIRRYGYLLTRVMLVVLIAVFGANLLLHRPAIDSLLFAVALAVGISPELLPAIIGVTLARGAREMARRGVIVRRLNAIENFGGMDVLCTDKTGTLTVGVMQLDLAAGFDGQPAKDVLRLAALNAGLQTGMDNALDAAIIARAGADGTSISDATKVDEVPYDFSRKRLSVVARTGDGHTLLIAKGALEGIVAISDRVVTAEGIVPLDGARRGLLMQRYEQWSGEGFRVLGVASKEAGGKAAYGVEDEAGLAFAGFLLFLDPPKDGIVQAISGLKAAGVALKIITGDNRLVAAHVAGLVGIAGDSIVTGAEISGMGEAMLARRAAAADIFAEVDPGQKERIIVALRRAGRVVGYLGDGINDAPALHVADVGISVEGAADVAKDAADFVLLRHDLDVLRAGVVEGRATFANTLKYIFITTSANFGNMISMAIASAFLPFLPLLATQVLLNNFLSDLPALAIAGDNVDEEMLARPRRWSLVEVRNFMVVFGLISSLFDLITFAVLLGVFHAGADAFRTAWFVESLLTEVAVALVIRTHRPFYRSAPGRLLLILSVAVGALALALPWLPGATYFEFTPMAWPLLVSIIGIVAAYVAMSEVAKEFFYRRR